MLLEINYLKNQIARIDMKVQHLIVIILLTSCAVRKESNEKQLNHQKNTANTPDNKVSDSTSTAQVHAYRNLEEFKGDTLRFVNKSIVARKAQYIGKPLEVLLKDYPLPIKRFLWGTSHKNPNDSHELTLKIYDVDEREMRLANKRDPVELVVIWKTPLHTPDVVELSRRNKGWTTELQDFFGRQIIGDILLVDYKLENK